MKLKHIAKAVVLVLLLAFAINICYNTLSWKDTTGGYLSAFSQLYNTPEDTIDVVFVGSSHVYCGIYPSILWRDYGVASFDMSVSGQDKESGYYALKELLKTQKPKVVMVDLFSMRWLHSRVDTENQYRNLLGMKPSCDSINFINSYGQVMDIETKDYSLRFPIIHTRYKELTKYDFVNYLPSVYGKGEYIEFGNRGWYDGAENVYSTSKVCAELEASEYDWLEGLKLLSEEYGFELAFIVLPAALTDDIQERINSAEEWAEKNGVPVYDYNVKRREIGIISAHDYLDYDHLNAYGAEKMTHYIYDTFLIQKQLPDHRGEEEYSSWDLNLKRLQHEQNRKNLEDVQNVDDYCAVACLEDDLSVFISVEGDVTDKNYDDALGRFGIDPLEWRQGGFWISQNGKLRKLNSDELAQGVCLELGRSDAARVKYNSCLAGDNIQINGHGVSGINPGLNIVVYDNFLEEELPRREF